MSMPSDTVLPPEVLARFVSVVGEANALFTPDDQAPYLKEWRDLYVGRTPVVLRPRTTEEVAEIVEIAAAARVPLVPQGGNTGLVGGQTPTEAGNEVVLSLSRLNRIRDIDPAGNTMVVEAGAILRTIHEAAEKVDRMFPLTLASEGSCTIGGNISSNAGGTAVLAYGNTRDLVLGLEVVLPDGRIWNGLRRLKKDNTGYDLKQLFIGGEGTLGIVTAAVIKLYPRPKGRAVALIALETPEAALELLAAARTRAGSDLTAFELMSATAFLFTVRHAEGGRNPFAAVPAWSVLLEISSQTSEAAAREVLEALFDEAFTAGIVEDAVIAGSLAQAEALWLLRHAMSEVQRHEGGSIKHDISVPVASVPAFLAEASAAVLAVVPGCRPAPFGHLGDGNIHFNVSQPVGADKDGYLARWDEMNAAVHAVAHRLRGSVSAEHGIGRLKRDLMAEVKEPVELDLMRRIKRAIDPGNIMNPGRVV